MNEPKRLYLDTEVIHPAGKRKVSIYRTSDADIEYVRTDAFIEKAKKWFEKQNEWFDPNGNRHCDMEGFENFKNYMIGE